jgi:hypothetical protein
MIEQSLVAWFLSNPAISQCLAQTAGKADPKSCCFSFLPKQPSPLPAVIIDRLKSPNESETLDVGSAQPGQEIRGYFQFGCVAQDAQSNPVVYSGYLTAAYLARAIRRQFEGLGTGTAELPGVQYGEVNEGNVEIHDVRILDEYDAHYELGGGGYLLRRSLHVELVFVETT